MYRAALASLLVTSLAVGCADAPASGALLPTHDLALAESESIAARKVGGQYVDVSAASEGRKLIRTGSVSVVVDDYEPFQAELHQWLQASGGFVAHTNLSHTEGHVSWASLQVRVPAERFDALLAWTDGRVEVASLSIDSADVTEQWVDLDARLTNMRRAEVRLARLLEAETTALADVLAVERELVRVRGEIDSLEGRLRVLNDQISLATLSMDVQVRQSWSPTVARPFTAQMRDTLDSSLAAMGQFAAGLVLLAVAASPWLAVASTLLLAFLVLARSAWRRVGR